MRAIVSRVRGRRSKTLRLVDPIDFSKSHSKTICFYNVWSTSFCEKSKNIGLELHGFTMFARPTKNVGLELHEFTMFARPTDLRSADICFYNVWSTSFSIFASRKYISPDTTAVYRLRKPVIQISTLAMGKVTFSITRNRVRAAGVFTMFGQPLFAKKQKRC